MRIDLRKAGAKALVLAMFAGNLMFSVSVLPVASAASDSPYITNGQNRSMSNQETQRRAEIERNRQEKERQEAQRKAQEQAQAQQSADNGSISSPSGGGNGGGGQVRGRNSSSGGGSLFDDSTFFDDDPSLNNGNNNGTNENNSANDAMTQNSVSVLKGEDMKDALDRIEISSPTLASEYENYDISGLSDSAKAQLVKICKEGIEDKKLQNKVCNIQNPYMKCLVRQGALMQNISDGFNANQKNQLGANGAGDLVDSAPLKIKDGDESMVTNARGICQAILITEAEESGFGGGFKEMLPTWLRFLGILDEKGDFDTLGTVLFVGSFIIPGGFLLKGASMLSKAALVTKVAQAAQKSKYTAKAGNVIENFVARRATQFNATEVEKAILDGLGQKAKAGAEATMTKLREIGVKDLGEWIKKTPDRIEDELKEMPNAGNFTKEEIRVLSEESENLVRYGKEMNSKGIDGMLKETPSMNDIAKNIENSNGKIKNTVDYIADERARLSVNNIRMTQASFENSRVAGYGDKWNARYKSYKESVLNDTRLKAAAVAGSSGEVYRYNEGKIGSTEMNASNSDYYRDADNLVKAQAQNNDNINTKNSENLRNIINKSNNALSNQNVSQKDKDEIKQIKQRAEELMSQASQANEVRNESSVRYAEELSQSSIKTNENGNINAGDYKNTDYIKESALNPNPLGK